MARSAQEVFDTYRANNDSPFLRGIRGTYLFNIEDVGDWFVSVDDGKLSFDEKRHSADCEIRCNEQDFVDMIEGRRNLLTSFLQGRVQVRGDISLAQKFHGFVSSELERKKDVA